MKKIELKAAVFYLLVLLMLGVTFSPMLAYAAPKKTSQPADQEQPIDDEKAEKDKMKRFAKQLETLAVVNQIPAVREAQAPKTMPNIPKIPAEAPVQIPRTR